MSAGRLAPEMADYVDPGEADPAKWAGSTPRDELDCGRESVRTVVERALATETPYRRKTTERFGPGTVREEFDTREYRHAKVHFNCGVTAEGRIKLMTRGYLWGADERHQRYRSQYRREAVPADAPPFETYTVWNQYQFGTASRDNDGTLSFDPDPEASGEYLRTVAWADLFTPVRSRLAELELVRNPAFAKYRLEQLGEWAEVGDPMAFDVDAFDVGP